MKTLYAALFAIALSACATTPQNPQQAVFIAKQDYTVALTIAVAYKRLPPCTPTLTLCADPVIVRKLQVADDSAIVMLDGAELAVRSGGTGADVAIAVAEQAVKVLTILTAKLKVN